MFFNKSQTDVRSFGLREAAKIILSPLSSFFSGSATMRGGGGKGRAIKQNARENKIRKKNVATKLTQKITFFATSLISLKKAVIELSSY